MCTVHPLPFCSSPSPPKGRPFQKTELVFIAPYLMFSLPDDVRVAWLVPIHGTLPWEHCTLAVFLDASHIIPIPSSSIANQVSWTQGSLLKFWNFLLRLPELGKLGSLGIYFTCVEQVLPGKLLLAYTSGNILATLVVPYSFTWS